MSISQKNCICEYGTKVIIVLLDKSVRLKVMDARGWRDCLVQASNRRDKENCAEFAEDEFREKCISGWGKFLTIISLLEVYCMA